MLKSGAILKETVLYGLSKAIPGLTGLLSVIFFLRFLGTEGYGQYSIILAQCNLFASFGFGWINHALLRYNNSQDSEESFNLLIKGFLFSSLIVIGLFIVFLFFQKTTKTIILLSMFCTISIALFSIIKIIFQAKIQPLKVLTLTSFQSILGLIIPLFLLQIFHSWEYVLLGVGISFFVIINYTILNKSYILGKIIKIKFLKMHSKRSLKKWLSYGAPISMWFALSMAFPFFDRLFIKQYLSLESLGSYAAVQEFLYRIYSFILFPMIMALHPKIMNYWNEGFSLESIRLIKKGIIVALVLLVLIIFPTLFLEKYYVYLLSFISPDIPHKFSKLILPLVLAGFLWQLSLLTHKMIELKEDTKWMVIFMIISLIINIIGNNIFLPKIGLLATAYTAVFSSAFYLISTSIYSIYFIRKFSL